LGDMGFLLGIAGVLYFFGSLDYATVFHRVSDLSFGSGYVQLFDSVEVPAITLITLCLFLGAMGKSAQIPLHVWLPDSMEGPTPILALIHAATMVTAGVFMLARLSPLFEYSMTTLDVVLMIGSITALLTGILGIVQSDIKRIIAYSTLSQLGYMMTAMGVSAYSIGIFHLMTHAFFKALLFLAAGSVIIALHHEQNIWKMGNLKRYLPITYITMLIGCLALIGFPGFSGFYSKDLIIEAVGLSTLPGAKFAYAVVLGSVFITGLYTFRLFFVVFHGKQRMGAEVATHVHESPAVVWIPLVLLAIPSIVAGAYFLEPLFNDFFGSAIVVHPEHQHLKYLAHESGSALNMALHGVQSAPFWLAILGVFTAWFCYILFPKWPRKIRDRSALIYYVLKEKYGFDAFYEWIIARGGQGLGWICWRFGDQWLIDGIGVNGTADNIGRMSYAARHLQTGYVYHYAFTMIVGFLVLTIWMLVY
jgi:NADH-quinone oxidoreductase subunit L